jgi:hypothetical protein
MSGGFFNSPMPTNMTEEQLPQPQAQSDVSTPVTPSAPVIPADGSAAPPVP